MVAKSSHMSSNQSSERKATLTGLDPCVALHYGIPFTASILAFDPIWNLLAVGTLDGRIKVLGGSNIEGLLMSPKQLPFKNLEFLQNQGFLASVSNENDIQVWDIEERQMASTLQWESNITAFSVISGTDYIYIGDEYGKVSVLKYDTEEGKIHQLPYQLPAYSIAEATGISIPDHDCVVGLLPQPCSHGNRLLIAYENGLLVLWEVSEGRAVLVRGNRNLQLNNNVLIDYSNKENPKPSTITADHEEVEKEISSLCWASSDGSVLAVGYVDGDILLWNLSTAISTKNHKADGISNDVVKLQLSSSNRRLPIIVLRWSADRFNHDCAGELFVYGGDDIGSEEVLTILRLNWSTGFASLKCIHRVDLTLNGSFADVCLLINAAVDSGKATLCILTNPGQLHIYDDACMSALKSQQGNKSFTPAVQYQMVVPTVEPHMTSGKLVLVHNTDRKFSGPPPQMLSAAKAQASHTSGCKNWPLTGGALNQLPWTDNRVERVLIAGYGDGSIRVWDARYSSLVLVFYSNFEVDSIKITGISASVSALEFCSTTFRLAVGNEVGMVRFYDLTDKSNETTFHVVTEADHEVRDLHHGTGAKCFAVFSILSSPVCALEFTHCGDRLAVGFECGRVAVLDVSLLSILFLTDYVSGSSAPAIPLAVKLLSNFHIGLEASEESESRSLNDKGSEFLITLTRDAQVIVMDGATGNMINSWSIYTKSESAAISMHIIELNSSFSDAHSEKSSQTHEVRSLHMQAGNSQLEHKLGIFSTSTYCGKSIMDFIVLFCCEDAVHIYHLKSVLQGENDPIKKLTLEKPCCWATTFEKNEEECGLVVFYPTGVFEIRSLPDLEVVTEFSLMSILRWNFKANMEKTLSSSRNGQITMVNGGEFAILSLLACENFRIRESAPLLHNKAFAAAAHAPPSFSSHQKKKQEATPKIFGAIIKGFKKAEKEEDNPESKDCEIDFAHLESLFSRSPALGNPATVKNDDQVVELDIDNIQIDEPSPSSSSSSPLQKGKNDRGRGDKILEREKLFEGATGDGKPKRRTREEIIAQYRFAGDTSAAAAHAKNKLMERQEKLERLSKNSEELRSGAEDFASLANELAKNMEKRKWWKL